MRRFLAGLCALTALSGCGRYEGPTDATDAPTAQADGETSACSVPPLPKGEKVRIARTADGELIFSWLDRSTRPASKVSHEIGPDDHACLDRLDIQKLMVSSAAEDLRSPGPAANAWTMSPDSFGPVTTAMSTDDILATGAYRDAPNACTTGRLDWHSQTYERVGTNPDNGRPDLGRTPPDLPSISLGLDGTPEYIDPGANTRTDAGIRVGDTLEELQAAYPGRLIRDEGLEAGELGALEDTFAVTGRRSHLVFYLYKGVVGSFYLTPGAVRPGHFSADMRGVSC